METDPFRIRGHVANFDEIVVDIVDRSAATRQSLPMKADIAYGDGPSETLDIFFPPASATPHPVHIFIHGGYWRTFSKNDYSLVANTVTAAGAIAVIIDYALMPAVRMDRIIDQVRRAGHWVRENIAAFGGDPARLSVSGHSAGAHLATFLFTADLAPAGVLSATLLSGIYDLEPLQSSFLKPEIGLTDNEVSTFSPLNIHHDPSTVVNILVGATETPPFHTQADAFARQLASGGTKVSQTIIVARNHMQIVRDLGDPHTLSGRQLKLAVAATH